MPPRRQLPPSIGSFLAKQPRFRFKLLLPLLGLRRHGTEIERPSAVVMIGGLVTSTLFTLLALPTFYLFVHQLRARWRKA